MAEELVGRFTVRSDQGGKQYTAMEYQSVDQLRRPGGRFARIVAERLHCKLEDGRSLEQLKGDPNAFQISDTDEIVRKV